MPLQTPDDILEMLQSQQGDMAARQGEAGVAPNVAPEEQQLAPPAGAGGDLRRRIGSINGQDIYSGGSPGLNEQGQGAVGLPLSANPGQRPFRQVATDYGVPDPLTGVMVPTPGGAPSYPGNKDPWIADQAQKIEKSIDLLSQNDKLSDFQKQHAIGIYQRKLNQIDPQGRYRRGSPDNQLSQIEKFAAQNMKIFPEHGFALALDAKGQPHFHKLENNALELRKQHEEHWQALQKGNQERLQDDEKHRNEIAKMHEERAQDREKFLQEMKKMEEERKKQDVTQRQADRQAKLDEHSSFWTQYHSEYDKAYKRLTKKGVEGGPDTPPTKEEVDAHLKEHYRHLTDRKAQIEAEAKGLHGPPPDLKDEAKQHLQKSAATAQTPSPPPEDPAAIKARHVQEMLATPDDQL